MKLKDIVKLMNMAQLDVCSKTIREVWNGKQIDMFNQAEDETLNRFGECEVEQITNVCKLGVTIWIK